MIIKRKCGCITEDYKDGVAFIKICNKHKEGSYVWLVQQHKK